MSNSDNKVSLEEFENQLDDALMKAMKSKDVDPQVLSIAERRAKAKRDAAGGGPKRPETPGAIVQAAADAANAARSQGGQLPPASSLSENERE